MARSARLPLLILALVAAALLAGCGGSGGSGGGSGQDARQVLAETFSADKAIERGRLDLAFEVRAPGLEGVPSPLSVRLSGPFQASKAGRPAKFDFDLAVATRDGRLSLGLISTGDEGYLVLAQRAFKLGSPGDLGPGGASGKGLRLRDLGLDPDGWLSGVRDEGVTEIDGDKVIHLSADVDTKAMLADLSGLLGRAGGGLGAITGLSGALQRGTGAIEKSVKGASVDVWTGEQDRVLRRLRANVQLDTPGGRDGSASLELSVTGQDRDQAIGPPADPRPLSELTSALAALAARAAVGAQSTP